jgi:hypothetical protein
MSHNIADNFPQPIVAGGRIEIVYRKLQNPVENQQENPGGFYMITGEFILPNSGEFMEKTDKVIPAADGIYYVKRKVCTPPPPIEIR